jgi:hypothetical protein
MVDRILERFVVDDFDGDTAILYGPQDAFQMIEEGQQWTLTFDHDEHTWVAASYEDEDDPMGTVELEGLWDEEGHMFYGHVGRSESAVPYVSPAHEGEGDGPLAEALVHSVVCCDEPLGQRGSVPEVLHGH